MTLTPPAPGDPAFRRRPRRAAAVPAFGHALECARDAAESLDRLWWGGRRVVATASRWTLTAYQKKRILRAMDAKRDDELWDVGLRRCDLHDLATLPLGSDPGEFLTLRVSERRRILAMPG